MIEICLNAPLIEKLQGVCFSTTETIAQTSIDTRAKSMWSHMEMDE